MPRPWKIPSKGCYLLHFDRPYRHAQHYLGFSDDIPYRIAQHKAGVSGVKLIDAAVASGVSFTLTRVWPGAGRRAERRKKALRAGKYGRPRGRNSTGSRGRQCPLCKIFALQAALKRSTQDPETVAVEGDF